MGYSMSNFSEDINHQVFISSEKQEERKASFSDVGIAASATESTKLEFSYQWATTTLGNDLVPWGSSAPGQGI